MHWLLERRRIPMLSLNESWAMIWVSLDKFDIKIKAGNSDRTERPHNHVLKHGNTSGHDRSQPLTILGQLLLLFISLGTCYNHSRLSLAICFFQAAA